MRYGARPLKRAIERQLLGPLADGVSRYPAGLPLAAEADAADGGVAVDVRPVEAGAVVDTGAAAVADQAAVLRRDAQRLAACPAVVAATNLLFQLERDQHRDEARAKREPKDDQRAKLRAAAMVRRAEQIRDLRSLLAAVASLSTDVEATEDAALAAVYEDGDPGEPRAAVPAMQGRLDGLLLDLLRRRTATPDSVFLGVVGNPAAVVPLAEAYAGVASLRGHRVTACWYEVYDRTQFRRHTASVGKILTDPPAALAGVGLSINGAMAGARFGDEGGVHVIAGGGKSRACLVDVSGRSMAAYVPPDVKVWPATPAPSGARRRYDVAAGVASDAVLKQEFRWGGRGLQPVVEMILAEQLGRAARAVLER